MIIQLWGFRAREAPQFIAGSSHIHASAPEQFPGLVYRMREQRVAMLLFGSGKIVYAGVRKIEDASLAVDKLSKELTSLGLLRMKN
jgi:TATA-box binding protein (TBP) (component of TFIID and TFIIIB)